MTLWKVKYNNDTIAYISDINVVDYRTYKSAKRIELNRIQGKFDKATLKKDNVRYSTQTGQDCKV